MREQRMPLTGRRSQGRGTFSTAGSACSFTLFRPQHLTYPDFS
jgi:hypothetical protein